jgi:SEFIR domain
MSGSIRQRTVFMSYAHDSEEHKREVLTLAQLLVLSGVDVELDQWAGGRRQDWSSWAIIHMTSADFVLVVTSPQYKQAGDGIGVPLVNRGVQSEAAMLRDLLHGDRQEWLPKLLPVVLPGHEIAEIPYFLQPNTADHYRIEELSQEGIRELLEVINGGPVSSPLPRGSAGSRQWQLLPAPTETTWLSDITDTGSGQPTLEVHLVPVDHHERLQVRHLEPLADQLASIGRSRRLFTVWEQLHVSWTDQGAWAYSTSPREGTAGLAVLRSGQRSAWATLPRAVIGTLLIPEDVRQRLAHVLGLLTSLGLSAPLRVAPTVGLEPLDLVRIGQREDMNSTTAALHTAYPKHIRLPADEAVTFADLRGSIGDVAEELASRLIATFRRESR